MLVNARGAGTLVAVDAATPGDRDALITALRTRGVDIPPCGKSPLENRNAINNAI